MSQTIELIKNKLEFLAPTYLEIIDQSAQHAGHAGTKEGGHYELHISAARLQSLGRIKAHQLIYQSIGPLKEAGIHALSIRIIAPQS